MSKVTIGADPEVFIQGTEGKIVPAIGLIPGNKQAPFREKKWRAGYAIQVDNVMGEYNIPPATSPSRFANNMLHGLSYLRRSLPEGHTISELSEHCFPAKDLRHPDAKVIGCDIDLDAYEGGSPRTKIPALTRWRSAGGHIHIGGKFNCPPFVVALFMDAVMAVRSGHLTTSVGMSKERHKWYGQPGIFRETSYGIEYRSLSNRWVISSEDGPREDVWHNVSWYSLLIGNWLQETSAAGIRTAFKQIDWGLLRDYIINYKFSLDRALAREQSKKFHELRRQLNSAGVPPR